MQKILIESPSTIANIGCGFDILGMALDQVGETMILEKNKSNADVEIQSVEGANLSKNIEENLVGVVATKMKNDFQIKEGILIDIKKNILPGSGLGSSASSSVAISYGINELFELGLSRQQVLEYAKVGEEVATGSRHMDNIAPCLYGGVCIIQGGENGTVIPIDFPEDINLAVVYPQIEVKTSDSRRILKKEITLKLAISQWGNVAGLIAGFYKKDFSIIQNSLEDYIITPIRSILIPNFDKITEMVKGIGGFNLSIAGSGPTVFSFCATEKKAKQIVDTIVEEFSNLELETIKYCAKISPKGASYMSI